MRRNWKLWALAGLGVLATCIVVRQASFTGAQNPDNNGKPKAGESLPIRQVVLFNSGVGYFQREGEVEGNARIDLTFPTSDVNDLLKSLVLQDLGGGRVSTVSYDSHDPIDKILRSFAVDLNGNPTFGQILNQARGEKIEIVRLDRKDGQASKLAGIIVGMEVKRKPAGKDAPTMVDEEHLNLTTAAGLQSIPIEQVQGVKFLNPILENEFQRALKVLAGSHDTQKKLVSLGFNANGVAAKRAVRVGYVVERPIWKTSYRLRLEPNGKLFLQGWALVENTSDDDWTDVRMVLVSGKPISYQMNLYEPLYIPRPVVEPEMFASLRPPVYSGSMDSSGKPPVPVGQGGPADLQGGNLGMMGGGAPPVPGQLGQFGGGQFGQFGQFGQGQFGQFGHGQFGQFGGGFQGGSFQGGNFGNMGGNFNPYQNSVRDQQNAVQNLQNRLTYEELQQRRQQQDKAKGEAKKAGSMIAGLNFKEGIQSVATAEEIGDYFQYILDQKISLARQKSAMLPILDQTIEGAKVSIYNETTHAKYPLLGLKLKNTSGQPLTQGPITVYDNQTYAGDTRILDLQPNEERLLSYALDQSTEIKTGVKATPSPEMNFKIDAAQLSARYKLRQTKTYTIKNRSTHDRTVILEHPIRSDFALIEPKKPAEKSRSHYRFVTQVAAGKTVSYEVVEEKAQLDVVALSGSPTPLYAVGLGIEVKPVVHLSEPKLTGLKINKGFVIPSWKVKESKTYFVQNLSEQARDFTVDHIIRPEWTLLDQDGDNKRGPEVFRFTLKVEKGKTGQKEIQEERTTTDKGKLLKEFPEAKVREFLASPIPSGEVKAALTKSLALAAKVSETTKKSAEVQKQLDALSKDQSRLRSNLQIIPQTSDHYKKFLEKFVSQETRIEGFQGQIEQLTATLEAQTREYEAFVLALNAE